MLSQQYQDNIVTLQEKIQEAEVIIVGGAAGTSAAAGYNWYRDDAMFRKYFNTFAEEYGIENIFGGFYYNFPTEEERWAYLATLVNFLELGVGQMTPMFIKEPFWNMTHTWPDAYYITINPKDALLPVELKDKGIAIHEDIGKVLRDVLDEKRKEREQEVV